MRTGFEPVILVRCLDCGMSDQVATVVESVEAGPTALARRGKVALPGLIVDAGPAAAERQAAVDYPRRKRSLTR